MPSFLDLFQKMGIPRVPFAWRGSALKVLDAEPDSIPLAPAVGYP
ncbi:MAG: hypothetical protein ACLPLP_08455 [Mycobacterium sp.]